MRVRQMWCLCALMDTKGGCAECLCSGSQPHMFLRVCLCAWVLNNHNVRTYAYTRYELWSRICILCVCLASSCEEELQSASVCVHLDECLSNFFWASSSSSFASLQSAPNPWSHAALINPFMLVLIRPVESSSSHKEDLLPWKPAGLSTHRQHIWVDPFAVYRQLQLEVPVTTDRFLLPVSEAVADIKAGPTLFTQAL